MKSVAVLYGAFCWDCDECGRENFCRGIEANLDEAHARELMMDPLRIDGHYDAIADIDPEADRPEYVENMISRVILAPPHVKCEHCGAEYTVVLPHLNGSEP
jgi:hypothetical protein